MKTKRQKKQTNRHTEKKKCSQTNIKSQIGRQTSKDLEKKGWDKTQERNHLTY